MEEGEGVIVRETGGGGGYLYIRCDAGFGEANGYSSTACSDCSDGLLEGLRSTQRLNANIHTVATGQSEQFRLEVRLSPTVDGVTSTCTHRGASKRNDSEQLLAVNEWKNRAMEGLCYPIVSSS